MRFQPLSALRIWGMFSRPTAFASIAAKTLLVVNGTVPIGVSDGTLRYVPSDSASLGLADAVRMGECVEAACADDLPSSQVRTLTGSDVTWQPSRALMFRKIMSVDARSSEAEAEAAMSAVPLLNWHRSNAFGGDDGLPTTIASGGRARTLSSGRTLYPRINPVCIVVVEDADGERCLLGRMARYPPGMYTCISGFVEHAESAEAASAREVLEEVPIRHSNGAPCHSRSVLLCCCRC
jgi:NAD+ diphosphatase